MTKVALYAGYSSDNQSIGSIEDQFRICREHVEREKWKVVGTCSMATSAPSSNGQLSTPSRAQRRTSRVR